MRAQANPALTTSFLAADGNRTSLDVGGVWNGTSEVTTSTGDTFSLTVTNNGAGFAYDLSVLVQLPVGLNYVPNTVAGVPGIAASASAATPAGTQLAISIPSGAAMAPASQLVITFGVTAALSATAGTYALIHTFAWADSPSGAQNTRQTQQAAVVQQGATTIEMAPNDQTQAIGATAQWHVTLTNRGEGGLFDVAIDESALAASTSLALTGMTQLAPAGPAAAGTSPVLTLPYLAAGESFVVQVAAVVTNCSNINNTVSTNDRTNATAGSASAQVTLDLTVPMLILTTPAIPLNYGAPVAVTVGVQNTGAGEARSVTFAADFSGRTVSNVTGGWSYSAGTFTYNNNGGTIASGASADIFFQLEETNPCSGGSSSAAVAWFSNYENACGQTYSTPTNLQNISAAADTPSIQLVCRGEERREVGQASKWTLTLSASNTQNIQTDPLVVTDVMPAGVTSISVGPAPAGTASSCSGSGICQAGDVVTWTVPLAALAGGAIELEIDYITPSDPCLGGQFLSNTASVAAMDAAACPINETGFSRTLLINNPGALVAQTFNVAPAADGYYETGTADLNANGMRDAGEGEFLPFAADFSFPSGAPGTWTGSTYEDDFGGFSSQALVAGSLFVTMGASTQAVPMASVTPGSGPGFSNPGFTIDLAFLGGAAFSGTASVAGQSFSLSYLTTIGDAALPNPTHRFVQRSTLVLAGGSGGCAGAGAAFTLGAFVDIARAAARVRVAMPTFVDICETFPVTFTVSNQTVELASFVQLTVDTASGGGGDYEYVAPQVPTYGGFFSVNNVTYIENGGTNPSFAVTPAAMELGAAGTVTVMMRRKALSTTASTGITATVDYDDNETSLAGGRAFQGSDVANPTVVSAGDLQGAASPQFVNVIGHQARWVVYAVNGGDGGTYESVLRITVPAGLTPNAAACDAANAGFPVAVAGQVMTWSLGTIASGADQPITVVCDVAGGTCSIAPGSVTADLEWGCGGVLHQIAGLAEPDFAFAAGKISVFHDTSASRAVLCGTGRVEIALRNIGLSYVDNAAIFEALDPANTGVDLVPGTVEYKRNTDGAWTSAADPTGTGAPYQFSSSEIPALARLAPPSVSGGVFEVRIRFDVSAGELANSSPRALGLSATATLPCGDAATSTGETFPLPMDEPSVDVVVTGRNVTVNQQSYEETVFGSAGDVIEWRVQLSNRGGVDAEHVRLTSTLPASGASTYTITGPGHGGGSSRASGSTIDVPNLGGSPVTFLVTETLGSLCVDGTFAASATWGCTSNGATSPSNLSSPGQSSASANIRMIPSFAGSGTSQTFTPLPGGRTRIAIELTNQGGRAESIVITDNLPTGFELDTSAAIMPPSGSSTISGVSVGGTLTSPTFALTGHLRNGVSTIVTFEALPTAGFDTLSDPFNNPETLGNGYDPVPLATGPNLVVVDHNSGCATAHQDVNSASLDAATPDIDITVAPSSLVVAAGEVYVFDYTLTNVGEPGSMADGLELTTTLGAGWSNPSVEILQAGVGGTTGVCSGGVCAPGALGTLAAGFSAVVRVTATASAAGALTMAAAVEGSLLRANGNDTTHNYTLDEVRSQVVGFESMLTLLATSESETSGSQVAIGEEQTWRLRGRFFGGVPMTSIEIHNTLPDGLGYVAHAPTSNHDVTINTTTLDGVAVSASTAVASGRLAFGIANTANGTFEVDVVARALNVPTNTADLALVNNLGASLVADFAPMVMTTFASDAPADGFAGSEPSLHAEARVTVTLPVAALETRARNVTTSSALGESVQAQAGDVIEYETTITNDGNAPLFDLSIGDVPVASTLLVVDGASDGVDNDGDGLVDSSDGGGEGTYATGTGGSIGFVEASTQLPLGSSLQRLDPGETVTLRYRVTLDGTVVPDQQLLDAVTWNASTLPGANGGQTANPGAAGSASGERELVGSDSATVEVVMVMLAKTVDDTSVGDSTGSDVFIGEQIRFELTIVLPAGQVPDLAIEDVLPAGLALLATPAVTFGSAISPSAQPSITPGSLPASGSPLVVQWDFGTRSVAAAAAADRTVTISYLVQVENISANVGVGAAATQLLNSASYSFVGSSANTTTVALDVAETELSVSQTASPSFAVDAGQVVTYTVQATNTGSHPAYDLEWRTTLPAGMTFVANSTNAVAGPTIAAPSTAGATVTWGRSQTVPQDIDLAAGQTMQWTYQVLIGDGVQPDQVLTNQLIGDWTSLDGAPGPNLGTALAAPGAVRGERTGSAAAAAANGNSALGAASTTIANVFLTDTHTVSGDSLAAGGFRIGDLVTWTTRVTLQEGTVDAFRIEETLPAGLSFFDAQPITPSSGSNGFTFVQPTGANLPSAGDSGTLVFNLGTVVNAGDNALSNDQLTLVYRARIEDDAAFAPTPTTQSVDGTAQARYQDSFGNAESTSTLAATIALKQPLLEAVSDLRTAVASGADETVGYRITLSNRGDAPAYNVQLADVLPVGMRGTTPVAVAASLAGDPVALGAPSFLTGTGRVSWSLPDGMVVRPGESLVVDYNVVVDTTVGAGLTLANAPGADRYFSKPSAAAIERRQYAASNASPQSVTTPAPIDIRKAADVVSLAIGEVVTYTLTVPATPVDATVYDLRVADSVDARLRVTGVADNAAALGTASSSNASGNSVDVSFAAVPPNTQAVVTVTAVVENQLPTTTATAIPNVASYTWAQASGGPAQPAIASGSISVTVEEPNLDITKSLKSQTIANPMQGLQAGDTVTYTITLTNSGDGAAYDFVLRDIANDEFVNPVVTANPDSPGAVASSVASGSDTVHTWNAVAGPIAPNGGTYQFDVTFTVANTVQPFQNLANTAEVDWFSAPGPNPDRRGPSSGYTAATPSAVTVTAGSITMTKVDLGDGGYTIGDDVTYRLVVQILQGQVTDLHVVDDLPAGLELRSSTFAATDLQQSGGGAVVLQGGPAQGATGVLDWDFGDLVSSGGNPNLQIDLVARVLDVPANVGSAELTNSARTTIEFPPGSGSMATIQAQADPQLTILEPELVLAFDAPATVVLGTPADLQIRVRNDGSSTAWQPTLMVELPVAMRGTDPATLALAVAIVDGRMQALAAGTDYSASWDETTGLFTMQLLSAAGFLAPGETLTADFQAALNADASDGVSQSLVATVTMFEGQDHSASAPAVSRAYPTAFGSGTLNTPNALTGDDPSDGASIVSAVPVLTMTKAVDQPAADPGALLHYTLTVANTGSAAGQDAVLRDDLDAAFAAGSLQNVSVTPAAGIDASDASGGANGSGLLLISGLTIPSGNRVTIEFDAQLQPVLPNGSTVANQASLTLPVFPDPVVSDSTRAADDDGLETGNDPGDPNDDDPTDVVIGSMPVFALEKTVTDLNGGDVEPGDVLEWLLTLRNTGNEIAEQTVLTDAIPANTGYLAGSTTVNGQPVADVAGASALPAGLSVASPGAGSGMVRVGEPVVVTFRSQIGSTAANGSLISNQARVEGRGEGTAALATALSDDPATQSAGDPTAVVVGSGPGLRITKSALDSNGAPLLGGETVRYSILIENIGNEQLDQVVMRDVLAAGLAYVPGTLAWDPDASGPAGWQPLSDGLDGDVGDYGITSPGAVTVHAGTLAASNRALVQFDAAVAGGATAGTILPNQAQVDSQQLPTQWSDADGNASNGSQPTIVVVGNVAALAATKSITDLDGGILAPGDRVRFTIRVRNPGTQDASNVVVTDPLPLAVATYVAGSTAIDGGAVPDTGSGSALQNGLALGSVVAGGERVVTVEMLVGAGANEGDVVRNQASFTADGPVLGTSNQVEVVVGGSPGSATVRGNTWLDSDHDRARGSSEPPEVGWTIEVLRNGVVVAATVSDVNGTYELTGLLPGSDYEIRFRHPETAVVYGGAISSAPGATTAAGTIQNLTLASGSLTLEQSLPIDPSGVFYDAVTRAAVAGVTVTMSGPAGFDPLLHLLPGQAVQTTDASGFYRFDLTPAAPVGVYTLRPVPPAGFLPSVPSQIVPPLAGPLDPTGLADPLLVAPQNGPPQAGAATSYYLSFDLAPGDPNVVNNHVALDPVLEGAIVITKTSPKTDVVRGELVPYEITVRNTVSASLPNLDLIDVVPPGFQYVSGSASLDGVPTAPVAQGRTLSWPGLSLAGLQERRLQLLLVVGVGSDVGNYVNRAHVLEPSSSIVVSNVATATVRVVPDPLFDGSDVIGKVFDDANANGVQDPEEPGMPGVRLVTARGLVVLTDEFGRYHVTDPLIVSRSRGANFIIKLDVRSLPTGYRLTTENPRVIRLTRGKISKANFGIARMRVVRVELSGQAFVAGPSVALKDAMARRLETVVQRLEETPSLLRLAYVQLQEDRAVADKRLEHAAAVLKRAWAKRSGRPPLVIEVEIVRASFVPGTLPEPSPLGETLAPARYGDGLAGRIEVLPFAALTEQELDRHDVFRNVVAPASATGVSLRVRRPFAVVAPALGVAAYAADGGVRFEAISSFPSLAVRGEIVIKHAVSGLLAAKLPLGALWQATWRLPDNAPSEEWIYALRVHMTDDSVYQTGFGSLTKPADTALAITAPEPTLVRLPPHVSTTALRIEGTGAAGHRIWIDGIAATVRADGTFCQDLLLPAGQHELRVTMQGPHGNRRTVARTVRVSPADPVATSEHGKVRHRSAVRIGTPPPNTERSAAAARGIVPPFRISVDGEPAGDRDLGGANAARATDLALADAHVQVRFDGLRRERRLNVSTWPDVAVRGEPVVFDTYSNYSSWLVRAEVRIHARDTDAAGEPLLVLPLDANGRATWRATPGFGDRVDYVLRVYGREGRFDETRPKSLAVVAKARPVDDIEDAELLRSRLYGTSNLRHANIELSGGTVQVHGSQVPPGYRVLVNQRAVPVDPEGRFVTDRILSPGTHEVEVDLVARSGRTVRFARPIVIPDSDWFYVAMADLTLSAHDTSGPGAERLSETAGRDDVFLDGRVALYVKGRIKGDWLLTAMLDTGEEGIEDVLKNIDDRDPRQLLRRLDPDRYYNVYGDDSTTQWDAATMGKFYVRIERGATHVLWGNFQTQILDTEFGQLDRALYGAKLHWQSEAQNERGQPALQIDAYAAEPETIQSREQFRGTGGSLYYLRNQDLTIGSERLRVEVRDRDSGLVLEARELRAFEDYDLNYIQGRILLSEPLASVAGDGFTVRNASLAGHAVYLVVRYEYRPALGTLDNMSVGGRVATALGESVELGVTGGRDEQLGVAQELVAADVTVRASDRTWFKVEAAQSDGPGLGELSSVDGGFAFGNVPLDTNPVGPARALRFETAFDLRDAFGEDFLVDGTAYYEQRDGGFSAPGRQTLADTYQWGVRMGAQLSANTRLDVKWDRRRMDFGSNTDAGHFDVRHDLDKHWSVQGGLAYEDNQNDVGSPLAFQQGKRLDAALQVAYESRNDWQLYVFGQATLERDASRQDMSRGGVGGSVRLSDRVTVGGEVSGGATGLGAKADLKWKVDERTDTYLTYGLGTDSTAIGVGQRAGTLTSGAKHRYSDAIQIYGEERYRHGDGPEGLTHAYGVDFTPDDRWTLGASVEDGQLIDPLGGAIERTSVSLTGGYRHGTVRYGAAVELRDEAFGGVGRQTWLVRNNLAVKLSPDWRGLAKANMSFSDGAGGQFFDGDFVEVSTGLAYRPVANDRWNWLLTYSYLADLPSLGQVTRTGGTFDFEQRSHVLAYDVTWDACDWMSIGGKYALRHGELRLSRTGQGEWFDSTTQLAIVRLDWHAVHEWDVHLEGRWRDVDISQDERLGALLGAYRHMSENVRFGVGYNFTDFSDRITDLRYDSDGFFVNLAAKF
ncbi:MAG: hypothetical protein AB8H80_23370 [Planctomycetota bacterium]